MTVRKVTLQTADEVRLEGRFEVPEDARGGVVLCHPHPLYEGSMSSIMIPHLQRAIAGAGWAALRFNFRGVGKSEGRFDGGIGEGRDVQAALSFLATELGRVPLAVVGWSFGAMAGLVGAAGDTRVVAYVAIAPPVTSSTPDLPAFPPPERLEGWRARILAICGTQDQYCTPEATAQWAKSIKPEAEVRVVEGADHFFTGGAGEELERLVVEFVTR